MIILSLDTVRIYTENIDDLRVTCKNVLAKHENIIGNK